MQLPDKIPPGSVSFKRLNDGFNKMREFVASLRPQTGPTARKTWRSSGVSWQAAKGGSPGSSTTIKCVTTIIGLSGDYATGVGVDDGVTYTFALPWPLRRSNSEGAISAELTSQWLGGQERRVTGSIGGLPVTELQHITPSYGFLNEIIIIAKVGNDALDGMRTDTALGDEDLAIEWADLNVAARAWAAVAVISGT